MAKILPMGYTSKVLARGAFMQQTPVLVLYPPPPPVAKRARKGVPQNKSEHRSPNKIPCMRQTRSCFSKSSGRPVANRTRKGVPQTKSARRSPNKVRCMPQMRSCFSKSSGRLLANRARQGVPQNNSAHRSASKKTPDRRVCADTGFFYIPVFVGRSVS
jgi:hypothetical protein